MRNFFVIFLFLISLQSCDLQKSKTFPNIGSLLHNSSSYDGKIVRVRGEVSEPFNLFGFKGFFLRDATGEIVVLMKNGGLPNAGENVMVRGTFREAFRLGDHTFAIIEAKKVRPIK